MHLLQRCYIGNCHYPLTEFHKDLSLDQFCFYFTQPMSYVSPSITVSLLIRTPIICRSTIMRRRRPAHVTRMSACATEINSWMASNRLKLNPSNTELLWLGSSRRLKHCLPDDQIIAGVQIKPSPHVRNLGVMVDGELTMANHVSHLTRTRFYHLRQLRVVRRSLTMDTAHFRSGPWCIVVLTIATVHSSVYHSINSTNSNPSFVHLPDLFPGSASVSNLMGVQLHWLPFVQRIEFKLCSIVYKLISP